MAGRLLSMTTPRLPPENLGILLEVLQGVRLEVLEILMTVLLGMGLIFLFVTTTRTSSLPSRCFILFEE
jgi:hypothetical protein